MPVLFGSASAAPSTNATPTTTSQNFMFMQRMISAGFPPVKLRTSTVVSAQCLSSASTTLTPSPTFPVLDCSWRFLPELRF